GDALQGELHAPGFAVLEVLAGLGAQQDPLEVPEPDHDVPRVRGWRCSPGGRAAPAAERVRALRRRCAGTPGGAPCGAWPAARPVYYGGGGGKRSRPRLPRRCGAGGVAGGLTAPRGPPTWCIRFPLAVE